MAAPRLRGVATLTGCGAVDGAPSRVDVLAEGDERRRAHRSPGIRRLKNLVGAGLAYAPDGGQHATPRLVLAMAVGQRESPAGRNPVTHG
jgi:hypothetical protein